MLPCVCLVRFRSQTTLKCGESKPQATLSLMFLLYFDLFCHSSLNRRISLWKLFVLYNKQKTKMTIPDYSRICAKSLRIRFILASSFLLFPTFKQFMPNVLRGRSSPQRITRKHFENFRSVLAIIRNDNFFYHFFQFRHFQVARNGYVLVFLYFILVNSSCFTFFKAVTCLI